MARAATALAILALVAATPAAAVDVDAGDWLTAPAGSGLVTAYYNFSTASSARYDGYGRYSEQTSFKTRYETVKGSYFFNVFGLPAGAILSLSYGRQYDARVAGRSLGTAEGVADPSVFMPVWVVNQPESQRYLAITPYIWAPLGAYDRNAILNTGENRWKGALQVGFSQAFSTGTLFDLTGDVMTYGDNRQIGAGNAVLSQQESLQLQAWVRQDLAPGLQASLGYSKTAGGRQFLNGIATGLRTDNDQVRVSAGYWLGSRVHLMGSLTHDVQTSGGFKQDLGAQARLMVNF